MTDRTPRGHREPLTQPGKPDQCPAAELWLAGNRRLQLGFHDRVGELESKADVVEFALSWLPKRRTAGPRDPSSAVNVFRDRCYAAPSSVSTICDWALAMASTLLPACTRI